MSNHEEKKILGVLERVSFPEYGVNDVVARIDTGAQTGAFHCTNISLEEVDGASLLHFSPFGHPEIIETVDNYAVDFVKSSNGQREQRYFVKTTVVVNGEEYPIVLSLADRSSMQWPVLIGRRFLRQNHLLVDAKKFNR